MRAVFVLLIVLLPVLLYGQSYMDIGKRLKLLEEQTDFKYDTAGFSLLPKFDFRCDRKNKAGSEYFHVTDINSDDLPDLIFSGPCSPHHQTGIFLNTGKSLKKVFDYPGKIVSVEKNSSITTINILKEAADCDFYSQFIQVVINHQSQVTKHTIVFGAKTKIAVGNKFKEDKVMGTLRTTPHINDVVKRDLCNNSIKGNQLTRIHEFKDIIQINRSGPWWLVLYPENNERSWVGWIRLE
ncbi:hypothetical protein [Chryseolinea sp. H1M3-3]|uniref:hypothetical protein n=1 Tax=Chryseolinea sp. H1M3-3 TaxID=3034144 RepID=UPI0023EE103E|nr:hypothetical protein [Chryseolinea sp. H1M3-3]